MYKVTAIVLAAGQGKRMNSAVAKQFLMLIDKPIIYYSLKAFEESLVDEIILVTGDGQVDYCLDEIVGKYHITKVGKVVEGGNERYDSVYQALLHAGPTDYVLIHDGARPFITTQLINGIIDDVKEWKACILGMPVKETIKIVDDQGFITTTPDRNTLWSAQTPQAFEYASILKAYEKFYHEKDGSGITITDDAMVYEAYTKQPVRMLPGDYSNIKITTPEDLIIAEELIKHQN